MGQTMWDRRRVNQLLAMSLGAAVSPAVPAWAQAKKRDIVIGHTGITWPARAPRGGGPAAPPPASASQAAAGATGAGAGGRAGGPPPPDPALNEAIVRDIAELGFAGLELFDWQVSGLEGQGVLAGFVEK